MTEERIPKEWAIVVVHGFGRQGQDREEETIVPIHWVDQKTKQLFWPPSKSQEGNFNAQPTDTWKKYVLKKIKFQGDKLTCEKVYNENLLSTSQSECDANTSKVSNMDTMNGTEMPNPITENILINQSSTPGSKLQQPSCSRSRNSPLKSSCFSLKSSHSNSSSRSMSRRRSRSISRRRSRSKSRRSRSKSRRSCSKSRRSRSKLRRSRSKSRRSLSKSRRSLSKSRRSLSKSQRSRSRSSRSRSRRGRSRSRRSQTSRSRSRSPSMGAVPKTPSPVRKSRRSYAYGRIESSPESPLLTNEPLPQQQQKRNDSASFLAQQFPLETGKYQRSSLTIMLRIENKIDNFLANNSMSVPNKENCLWKQIQSIEDFDEGEQFLQDNIQAIIMEMKRIGGDDVAENTRRVMERFMTYDVMSKLNFKGTLRKDREAKRGFQKSNMCKAVVASVLPNHSTSENDIEECVKNILKHAPKSAKSEKNKRKSL